MGGESQRAQGGGFYSKPGEKLVAWARAETVEVVRNNHIVCMIVGRADRICRWIFCEIIYYRSEELS